MADIQIQLMCPLWLLNPAGDLEQARQHAEVCLRQAEDGGWLDSAGRSLRLRACQVLWRIYTQLADAPLSAANYNKALTLLHKSYSMAAECRWRLFVFVYKHILNTDMMVER